MVKIKLDYTTSHINVGYTAEWDFYLVKQYVSKIYNKNIEIVFYQDHKRLEVIIPSNHDDEVIILMFEYDSISFINISKNNSATLGYKYPPKIYKAKRYMRNSYQDRERIWKNEDIVDNVINGTAINFTLQKDEILNQMMRIFNIEITDQDFNVLHNPVQLRSVHSTSNFYEAAVISLGYPGLYLLNRHTSLFGKINDDRKLEQMYYHIKNDLRLSTVELAEYMKPEMDVSAYVLIKTAMVTPTRIVLTPPSWKASSYGLRRIDTNKVLSVDFRDDDGRQLSQVEKDLIPVVINCCKNGLRLGCKTYNELFCSSSKFREHSSFFYEGDKREILTILKSLGEFEPALPAKLGARIGLNSSSVRQGIVPNSFKIVEDVMSQGGQYNFTDGCGQISMDFAKKLSEHLNLEYLPSAFQIRFPGFKGVLLVSNSKSIHGYDIIFRKSQQKFRGFTDNETLDIITQSTPATMCLNKSFIEVLCQNATKFNLKDKVEKRIMELIDASILKIIDNCIDSEKFARKLEQLPKYMNYDRMNSYSKDELLAEPFLRKLVQSDSLLYLKNIFEKSKPVFPQEYGRQMIGVPDFDGYLKPGQVFIQYSIDIDPLCEKKNVVKGKVAITRSPQYNLGDIRFVEAVDVPELHHISDVIVFPIVGDRPIQDMMAGGDLDGDDYSVFWDPELMLPNSQKPAVFDSPTPNLSCYATIDTIQERYPEFREEFMLKYPIGMYSNAHFVIAERNGFDDYAAVKLAKKVDIQVNYFKSGIAAPEIENNEKSFFNPEHMRKDHRPMYRLDNLLSKIYTIGEGLYLDVKDIIKYDNEKNVYLDPLIDIQDWNLYSDKAKKFYNSFKSQVDRIQIQYGIKDVNELFSGKVTEYLNRISQYIHDKDSIISLFGLVQNNVSDLMKVYRKNLLAQFDKPIQFHNERFIYSNEIQKFAVACYKIAYQQGIYLSYPWLFWDVIDAVRLKNKEKMIHNESYIERIFNGYSSSVYNESFLHASIFDNILTKLKEKYCVNVKSSVFNKMIEDYRSSLVMSTNNITSKTKVFKDVINFVRYYGFIVYNTYIHNNDYTEIVEACRQIYLSIAFKPSPDIFNKDTNSTPERFLKIVLQSAVDIKTSFKKTLERKTGCKVYFRSNKQKKGDYLYYIIALGSKKSIEKLKTIFVLNEEQEDKSSSFDKRIDKFTNIVKGIQSESSSFDSVFMSQFHKCAEAIIAEIRRTSG